MRVDCDTAVIGAGVAGLSAALRLQEAGQEVVCLEAAGRPGGRILTVHDPLAPLPIELGAEFVHGMAPQVFDLARRANLTIYEHTAEAVHLDGGRVVEEKEAGDVGKPESGKDESFEDHLRRLQAPEEAKSWARIHVEGFNAARSERISTESLAEDAEAADQIEGDGTFRVLAGYDAIPIALARGVTDLRLNAVVERVKWRRGSVEVTYRSAVDGGEVTVRCRKAIVTVSLGVLQARDGIRFDPVPERAFEAAAALEFGHVYRVTFRFREPFWDEEERFKKAGFLISKGTEFFAWWTAHPVMAPVLTGWCAGSAADRFAGCGAREIQARALASLSAMMRRKVPAPEAAYFHDWQRDPFFRGAYSYAPVGGLRARKALAEPVEDTLFFAGEAAETMGHSGTVHGAIASGLRAADLVMGIADR